MNLIIIEGPDRVGKNTLASNLTDRLDDFLSIHFTGPPKDMKDSLSYQFKNSFKYKANLTVEALKITNTVIWNRSHLGEYVYGQIYRNQNPQDILKEIWEFETKTLFPNIGNENIYAINLFASSDFLIQNDDGMSFSIEKEKKEKELEYFKDIFNKSLLRNKLNINIQVEEGHLKSPEYILEEVKKRFKF